MKETLLHLHHHIGHHIRHHHKKYLFGIFGGFAVVKLFLLVIGLSVIDYSYNATFAQLASGCTLTGQYYTGEYETGGYLTGQELTGGTLVDCVTIPGFTGDVLDETGSVIGQVRVEESQTGCVLTGQVLSEGYMTGYYLTGGYWTGGYLTGCATGTNETGSIVLGGNGICESGDVVIHTPISGSVFRNIFPVTWVYSGTDCLSGLSLQLWDHNSQWLTLGTVPAGVTNYSFDSKSLYSFQQSGLYHIIGTGTSGQYYLYTGMYTGTYSRLFSGYKLRLLTSNQTPVYETPLFTIDNEVPTLSGLTLLSSGFSSGYLTTNSIVTLKFTASEALSGIYVTLGSAISPTSSTVSGLLYTYIRNLSSLTPQGSLDFHLSFADLAGNTGAVLSSGVFLFDATRPVVSGFVFSGYSGGISLKLSGSEPIRYTFSYGVSGSTLLSGTKVTYLTAQQILFSGIERNQLYLFSLTFFDKAGNSRAVTGDFLQTTLGTILYHVYIVPETNDPILTTAILDTGALRNLAVVLKVEVNKFNVCKDALTYTPIELNVRNNIFTIQMPIFQKSQMKTLVNAFTLFVLDKVNNNPKITSGDIDEITKKFDSFLVILKLLRDDDNVCKQNLSNYHISQFKQTVKEFKLDIE